MIGQRPNLVSMRVGDCPRCRRRMVLVRRWVCGCSRGRHVKHDCISPRADFLVRRHECGHRLVPVRVTTLAEAMERTAN